MLIESQVKLKKWEVENIKQGHITDPFVGYIRQVIITTEYDPNSIQDDKLLQEQVWHLLWCYLPLFFATQVEVFLHRHPLNYKKANWLSSRQNL
jgi:hypothetical protein